MRPSTKSFILCLWISSSELFTSTQAASYLSFEEKSSTVLDETATIIPFSVKSNDRPYPLTRSAFLRRLPSTGPVRENPALVIRKAFPTVSNDKLTEYVDAYTAVFPLPMSHPDAGCFADTIPLVVHLAEEMNGPESEYEYVMDKFQEWELIAGFVLDLHGASVKPILDRINRDAQEDEGFNQLLKNLKGDLELREAARRQVVRSIAAAGTLSSEASDYAVTGNHLRLLGSQRDIFYHKSLLQVSALVAQSFDGTHAQEIFNFLLRKRMNGVWGPTRKQLLEIYRGPDLLDEELLPVDTERSLVGNQILLEKIDAALELVAEAQKKFKIAGEESIFIPLSRLKLRKDEVRAALEDGTVKKVINTCSPTELFDWSSNLKEMRKETEAPLKDFRKMRNFVAKDMTLSPTYSRQDTRPILMGKFRAILPKFPVLIRQKTDPAITAFIRDNPKTLDEVINGALKVIGITDPTLQIKDFANDPSHVDSLRCLFLNIYSPENAKYLLKRILGLAEGKWWSERGGELVYAAYLLAKWKATNLTTSGEPWLDTHLRELDRIVAVLQKHDEKETFRDVAKLRRAPSTQSDESKGETLSDIEEGEEFHEIPL